MSNGFDFIPMGNYTINTFTFRTDVDLGLLGEVEANVTVSLDTDDDGRPVVDAIRSVVLLKASGYRSPFDLRPRFIPSELVGMDVADLLDSVAQKVVYEEAEEKLQDAVADDASDRAEAAYEARCEDNGYF